MRLAGRSTWDAAVEPFSRVGLCTVQHLGRKACLTFSAACLRLVIDTLSPAPVIDRDEVYLDRLVSVSMICPQTYVSAKAPLSRRRNCLDLWIGVSRGLLFTS